MKVPYQVDRRRKFYIYLRIFFDFLDIGLVNSKIVYDKLNSTVSVSTMDFRFSLTGSVIGKLLNKKRAAPMHRPLKKSKAESFDTADHLHEFSTTHVCFTLFSSTKIENCTFVRCLSCITPLCFQKERNCFYLHHSFSFTPLLTINRNT